MQFLKTVHARGIRADFCATWLYKRKDDLPATSGGDDFYRNAGRDNNYYSWINIYYITKE